MGVERCLHIGPAVFCRRVPGVRPSDISDEIKEALFCPHNMGAELLPDTDIWIGNKRGDGIPRLGEAVAEMGAKSMAEAILAFTYYAEAIKVLIDRYGDENVRLVFAVVPYYS